MAGTNNVSHINFLDNSLITGLTSNVGDLVTHNGSTLAILPKGLQGQVLSVDTAESTDLKWINPPAANIGGGALGDVVYIDGSGNLTIDTGNFQYNATGRLLEFGCWTVDAYAGFPQGVCLGSITNQVTVGDSIALGGGSIVSGIFGVALGQGTTASGANSVALGKGAIARCDNMTNLSMPLATRKSEAAANGTDRLQKFSGGMVTLMTEVIDSTAAPAAYQIAIGTGCTFYPKRAHFVQTVAGTGGAGNTGTFDFGDGTTVDKYISVTNYKGNRVIGDSVSYSGFNSTIGTSTPTFTVSASGTLSGSFRVVWEGYIVENE